MNTNMYMYVCINCKKTKRKSDHREREKRRKMEAIALIVPVYTNNNLSTGATAYSHFLGGEALFLRYGHADNICIIEARANERQSLLLLFFAVLAGARTHTVCICLFPFFFPSLFISFYHRNKLMH
jgi:hypothetical protein